MNEVPLGDPLPNKHKPRDSVRQTAADNNWLPHKMVARSRDSEPDSDARKPVKRRTVRQAFASFRALYFQARLLQQFVLKSAGLARKPLSPAGEGFGTIVCVAIRVSGQK